MVSNDIRSVSAASTVDVNGEGGPTDTEKGVLVVEGRLGAFATRR
jgi:hypothetical protein